MNLLKKWKFWINRILTVLFLGSLVSVHSCKCDDASDPNCPNFDPCLGETSNFGDFYMEERIFYNGEGEYFKTDTTLERNDVRFTIYDQMVDSVVWYVGFDPKARKGKSFTLYFEEAFGEVEVTAIAYKKKAADCLGEAAGIDTVRKTLHVLEWWQAPYFGTFKGTTSEDPNNEFETIIDTISNYRGAPDLYYTTLLSNFPDGYSMPVPTDGYQNSYNPWSIIGYNGFFLYTDDDLDHVRANYNTNSKKLECSYFFNPRDGSDWMYKKKYIGIKID